jgi:uncharacterized membrane protein YphA (DoxX/SURF4 family)
MMWLIVDVGARLAIGVLLFAAGATKIRSRLEFSQSLQTLGIVNRHIRRKVALLLPWLELALGLTVLLTASKLALDFAALVLMSFALVLGAAVVKGNTASCGCFGGKERVDWRHPARNVLLASLSLTAGLESTLPLLVGIAALVVGHIANSVGRKTQLAVTR